jgi:Ca2+-binding RTX toxin-like protein
VYIEGTSGPDALDGTADADIIEGGEGGDILKGLGGNDRLDGGPGADEMSGGTGDDVYSVDDSGDVVIENAGEGTDEVRSFVWLYTLPDNVENLTGTDSRGQGLYGNALDNVITGYTGRDGLEDSSGGDDRLYGGGGDDGISVHRNETHAASNVLLDGGLGSDVLTFSGSRYVDTATLIGGDGDDHISSFRGAAILIDAGTGNDRVSLNFLGAQIRVTLGSGSDLLSLNRNYDDQPGGSITVTDFETGAAGDRLEIAAHLASILPGFDPGTSPFASQYLALVQVGADTVLRIDRDGPGGPAGFTDLVRFENSNAADFTQFNLGGYYPDGSTPGGIAVSGTAGNDLLWGTYGADVIKGFAGYDEIHAGPGDDRVEGGDQRDFLDGGFGNDMVFGDGGDDSLGDWAGGNDQLFGGEGKDRLSVNREGATAASAVVLDGGADNDVLDFSSDGRGIDSALLIGGEGNDDLYSRGAGTIVFDAGTGNDYVDIDNSSGLYTITLGAGYDQVYLGRYADYRPGVGDVFDTRLEITDFAPGQLGPGTDVLFFRDYLAAALTGWDGVADPFAAGFLELRQDGSDAVIRIDSDGLSGGDSFREFIRLANVDAGTLTAYNLNDLRSLAIAGGAADDVITAGAGNHRIEGRGGDDRLTGGEGDDIVDGGDGNDLLFFLEGGSDTGIGGAGNDVFLFGSTMDGLDVVDGGGGSDQIALQGGVAFTFGTGVVGVESIGLLSGGDTRFGAPGGLLHSYDITTRDVNVAAGVVLTVDGAKLRAGENLTFNGSAETDGSFFIYGGRGVDTLTGGSKNDTFLFGSDNHFGASDVVNGGAGIDQLALRGSYSLTFGAGQLIGIESIGLLSAQDTRYGALGTSYSYNLTMNDTNVAAGVQMTVDGAKLRGTETLVFEGSAESDGSFRVFGGANGDIIAGSQNGDVLQGNGGADQLTGGGGADTFRYAKATDSVAGSADHILDFASGTDRIDLSKIDANTGLAGDQAFSWIGSAAFSGVEGQLRAYQSGSDWFVEGDMNGDSVADLVIQVSVTAGPLVQGDFLP